MDASREDNEPAAQQAQIIMEAAAGSSTRRITSNVGRGTLTTPTNA